jgi:hypothetical protein
MSYHFGKHFIMYHNSNYVKHVSIHWFQRRDFSEFFCNKHFSPLSGFT